MTLEIETLKSQTNSLQAYVNSNEPSSSLDNFTALIKYLELQLAPTNDRNKRLENELAALRQNYKDKATTDNARDNKDIQDKYFVNPYSVSLSAQCGGTNREPKKILLHKNTQNPLLRK
jgi:DNA gyrase/topoisomerase IV subunit A